MVQWVLNDIKTRGNFRSIYNMFCDAFGDAVWSEYTFRRVLKQSVYISYDNSVTEKGGILIRKAVDEVEILNIAVHPKYQSQGIGTNLMHKAINYYSDVTSVFLEVATDNQTAISLYKKIGFEIVGKREKYYNRNNKDIDAWIMKYYN